MIVMSGLEQVVEQEFRDLEGSNIGLVVNQASISSDLVHAIEHFSRAAERGSLSLKAILGPQHGLWGHTQDNMIEWEGTVHPRTGLPVYSLYGKHRKPTEEMLDGVDTLVIDMPDIGAKYYTFIWTMALCMEAAEERGMRVVVLDRPNPIDGATIEGPYYNESYKSFVGLHAIAIRHGLTLGEVAAYLKDRYYPTCQLEIVQLRNWQREMYFDQTGLPWAMPSPNMPSIETAVVYPGMCLLEATNLSEGRGTTRPFEMYGAPWMKGWESAERMAKYNLPGVAFRALEFQPTFQKHGGKVCEGLFMHVIDRAAFKPFLTGIAVIHEAWQSYPGEFQWKQPPYEYEYEKMPFDILCGNGWIREMIEKGAPLGDIESRWIEESDAFIKDREQYLLY